MNECLFLRMPQLFKHIISNRIRIRPTIQQLLIQSHSYRKIQILRVRKSFDDSVWWYSALEISSGFHRATFAMNERSSGAGKGGAGGKDFGRRERLRPTFLRVLWGCARKDNGRERVTTSLGERVLTQCHVFVALKTCLFWRQIRHRYIWRKGIYDWRK